MPLTFPAEILGELENAVDQTPMFGVPLGATLNDVIIIDLINGQGQWNAVKWFRRLAARLRLCHRNAYRPSLPAVANDRVLVTWRLSTPRYDELLKPIVEELGPERCIVLYEKETVVPQVPPGAGRLRLFEVLPHDPEIWRPEFRRCWPSWNAALALACRRFGASAGMRQRLAIELVQCSQVFVGCRQFLQAIRPAAIVTEYDRGARWSCLVLAARSLSIPTFTLQHGVLDEQGLGYKPVLADEMFCWGEMARDVLVRAGVPPERLLLGGCPRLDRRLAASVSQGRARLGLDEAKPVVMLATAPYAESDRVRIVEIFASCMERLPEAAGIVRLHPSEKLATYRELSGAHPAIRFFDNGASTLDESIAAADIVVVHSSGLGSDALVKRRLTAVVDLPPALPGHGRDLVEQAQCPCARSGDELLAAVRSLLFDDAARRRHRAAAEQFVARFCARFGSDSAQWIAATVGETSMMKRRAVG